MGFKKELKWLKGRRIAVCEPDAQRFADIEKFLKRYGINVSAFNDVETVVSEIERRRYSTHRVFLAILIDFQLAAEVEQAWQETTQNNPTILKTPVVLMRRDDELSQARPLINKGYFRFQLAQPVQPKAMLRLLNRLNRWKKWREELSAPPRPSAVLGH